MFKRLTQFGPLFIIIAAVLWALDGVLRISLYTLPPAVVVFYEHAFGFLVLLIFIMQWIKELPKMTKKEWFAIIMVALFSGALGTILYTAALQKVNFLPYSIVVLLEQQLQPIWAILTAAILLKEKITKRFIIWALVALVAAYVMTFNNLQVNFATGNGTLIAALLAVSAGFMWGSSTAISKFVLNRVNFLAATAQRFFFAPIFALFFIIPQHETAAMFHLTSIQIWTLLAITFSTGMVAVAIYYYGLKRTPARISSICELAFPGTAVLIDYFYYHKSLTLIQWLGIVLLLIAIYQITQPLRGKSKELAEEFPKS